MRSRVYMHLRYFKRKISLTASWTAIIAHVHMYVYVCLRVQYLVKLINDLYLHNLH